MENEARNRGLLAWQWAQYTGAHANRINLALHVVTVPLFMAGTMAVALAPWRHWALVPLGLGAMAVAMALQGRGHQKEAVPPAPFRGPLDVVARIFAEQWITFPRYLLSGRFAAAWRAAR